MVLKKRFNRATGLPGSHGYRKTSKRFQTPKINTETEIKVRSKYEKTCVRFFQKRGIKFIYEPLLILNGRQYRPDFFLSDYSIFIEICGMNHLPYYIDRIEKKRKLYHQNGLKALFIAYAGKGSLVEILENNLAEFLKNGNPTDSSKT